MCSYPVQSGTTFTPRATFARNFFEAGGIAALSTDGFANGEAMMESFKASGAGLACLCSSDEVYAKQAVAALVDHQFNHSALKNANAANGTSPQPIGAKSVQ